MPAESTRLLRVQWIVELPNASNKVNLDFIINYDIKYWMGREIESLSR